MLIFLNNSGLFKVCSFGFNPTNVLVRVIICVILISIASSGFGQLVSPEKSAMKNIGKQNWDKAETQLKRTLLKDSANAASNYLLARFFFTRQNPSFNIDSAYLYALRAAADYHLALPKERERISKLQIDSTACVRIREKIDSAAFNRAKAINTEVAFLHFLDAFQQAEQRAQAIVLRDEAAYLDAVKANTYQSFLQFLDKYPQAGRAPEAKDRYEQLLFEAKTSEHTLKSYELFLREYPRTAYRDVIEQRIFGISTAPGRIPAFAVFIDQYPQSKMVPKARNILFHLLQDIDDREKLETYLNDSLRHMQKLNEGFLILVLKNGKFGFANAHADIVVEPKYTRTDEAYKCGALFQDILQVDDLLIARDGHVILNDSISGFEDLGSGFVRVVAGGCARVVHKSGFSIGDCADQAKILNNRLLAIQQGKRWALFSLTGIRLVNYEWDDVLSFGNILAFKRDGKFRLSTIDAVGLAADKKEIEFSETFDEVKPWSKLLIWVRKKNQQGFIAQNLSFETPLQDGDWQKTFFGSQFTNASGTTLYDHKQNTIGTFHETIMREPWIAARNEAAWTLINTTGTKSQFYDSIRFLGPFAFGLTKDSICVHLLPSGKMYFPAASILSFIPGKDSSAFLIVSQDKKKTVYDHRGRKLFVTDFDDLQHAGLGFFVFSKKEKKGLAGYDGKIILQPEYDAIGSTSNNVISLLKNSKFGAYHVGTKKLIKPQYDRNLSPYNARLIIAFQKGLHGFIDWDNKPAGIFEFEEIRLWNDTAALVRKGFNWSLLDIQKKKILASQIKNLKYITDDDDEKLAIVQQENLFGVVSNKRGFVIPATFSRVSNVGTREDPVYFTEKYVEEASIFVGIYYDLKGKLLFRQVYEEDDYDRIYCSDN
jgi:hypothetical protein